MKIRQFLNFLTIVTGAVAVTLSSLWIGKQAYSWLPPQGAAESHLIDDLFSFLVTLGSLIFLGVTATLFYSICFHRAKANDLGDGPHIEGNVTEEMGIQGPSHQIHLHNPMKTETADAALGEVSAVSAGEDLEHIDVLAKQWAWVFHYPQSNVTSTELHLPQGSRIRLNLHSEDVLHGFYIPAFRLKQDIIPGNDLDFEFTPIRSGTYDLTDSQYSGTYFATMRAKVVVESPSNYQQWLSKAASQTPSPAPNQAASEYALKIENGIDSGWKTVEPAAPPLVNFPD
jgi:cytochrome c oxidase subunit 2